MTILRLALLTAATMMSCSALLCHSSTTTRPTTRPTIRNEVASFIATRAFNTKRPSPIQLQSAITVVEGTERDLSLLGDWATHFGIVGSEGFGLEPTFAKYGDNNDDKNWAAKAIQAMPKDTPVLQVPANIILSSVVVREELGDSIELALQYLEAKGISHQRGQFLLFCKILLEYEKEDQSYWYAWMNSLPRNFYTAVSMDDFEISCLPPFLYSLSMMDRIHFSVFLEALQTVNIFQKDETLQDMDLLKWAFNCVYTRCWGLDEERCDIVPMADMFDHAWPSNILVEYDDNQNCIVRLKEDVQADQPLRMSYGMPTNPARLVATFGFFDSSPPATYCKILARNPSKKLVDVGYDTARMVFYTADGGISEECFDVVLYNLLERMPDIQETFYQAHMAGDQSIKMEIQRKYLLETCTSLKLHVDGVLRELELLMTRIDGQDMALHPRLPMIRKHNDNVMDTFSKVKGRLDIMIRNETERRRNER
ncbi:MAG: hypothetical protein SGBAC_002201 [Bacillariaceae sp.]